MPTIDIDRDAAHDAAQRELSKPIYPRGSLTQRILDWIDELIYKLLAEGASVPGGWFTVAVLVVLVVIAVVVVVVRVARRTMRTNRGRDSTLFGAQELTAAEHRSIAQRFAAQGEWAAAIRHRLRAVARELEESAVLNPVPGRTATELARDAGVAVPGLTTEFSRSAEIFNDVTYGERPGVEAGYRTIEDLDERLKHHSRGGPTPTQTPGAADGWAALR